MRSFWTRHLRDDKNNVISTVMVTGAGEVCMTMPPNGRLTGAQARTLGHHLISAGMAADYDPGPKDPVTGRYGSADGNTPEPTDVT